LDRLKRWSQDRPDVACLGFYDKGKLRSSLTYHELWKGIELYAMEIALKANRGDRAVLIIEPGMDFIVIFYACLRAGVIPVPCYTPIPGSEQRGIDVFANIATVSSSKVVILSPKLALLKRWRGNWPQSLAHGPLEYVVLPSVKDALSKHSTPSSLPMPARSDVAFLQFTSGSTGSPKGVIIDHGNLASNCCYALALFQQEAAFRQTEVICTTWLPMYHDMGLVLATCGPLFFGGQVHFMSPVDFLVDPLVWFDVMSLTKSNVSMAPNFAYNLVNRKWNSERAKAWDLSAMRCLYNSAEPIQLSTVQGFLQRMQQDVPSFPAEAYGVGYGMAESVAAIGISGFPHPIIVSQRHPTMVASVPNVAFYGFTEIVNPDTLQLVAQEGDIGEIWVRSPCIARGYWMHRELTTAAFHHTLPGLDGQWFRTGDLGFVERGHLFISGRLKDLIIINGRNFWPQDIEGSTQACHAAIRPGCVAAFAVASVDATESFVVVAEVRHTFLSQGDAVRKCEELVRLVDERIRLDFSHAPLHIVLVKEKTIPKTTSGKIRRKATKAEWEAGRLHVLLQYATQQHVTDYDTALAWVADVVRSCLPVPPATASDGGDSGDTGDTGDTGYNDDDDGSSGRETARIEQCTSLLKTFNLLAPDETIAHQSLDSLRLVELLHAMQAQCGQPDIGVTSGWRWPISTR
jgi:acyl-CoA synthetase (AMP-forming)/AMP-acid ligase II